MNGEQDGVDACYINHFVKYSVLVKKKMNVSITCFSEREVIFGIVHPQYRVIVGAGYATLGRGALVQRAVLCLPAQREREREGRSFTLVTHKGNECSFTSSVTLVGNSAMEKVLVPAFSF